MMTKRLAVLVMLGAVFARLAIAETAFPDLSFITRLPSPADRAVINDAKLLVGWATDAAAVTTPPGVGTTIDHQSTFNDVPSLAAPTPMGALIGTYRVISAPLNGKGYWGLPVEMIDSTGRIVAVLLLNRLFRLPVVLHDPIGVVIDILTVGALTSGTEMEPLRTATVAADEAYHFASDRHVPLIICGQSMSGAIAQYQIAKLLKSSGPPIGFLSFNAANANISLRQEGIDPPNLPGINFVKDEDPGFGPHSLLTNHAGLQLHIHRDGTGGLKPGGIPVISAVLHPAQHLLDSFQSVNLEAAMIEAGIFQSESQPKALLPPGLVPTTKASSVDRQ